MSRKKISRIVGAEKGIQAVVTDRGKVVTAETLKSYETSLQSKSVSTAGDAWRPSIIEPPYDLTKLMAWMNANVIHNSCVRVKAQDSVGIGYNLEMDEDLAEENEETQATDDTNYDRLIEFFNLVNPDESLLMVLHKVFLDYEGCGNGYIEVARGPDGLVSALFHINATTMRWHKDKKKLLQKVGDKYVYFKKFGEEQILNRETGNFVKRVDPDKAANEVIVINKYTWMSAVYGLPEWLPSLYNMFGDMKETEYNIDFFTNFGVPAYAIIVEGATLNNDVIEEIERYFEVTLKNSNHKTLVLSSPKNATLKFEKLNVDTKEASFKVYKKMNRESVLAAHKVPPYRVGIVEQGQLGGNVASESDRIYLDSVINPRQADFAWVINELIIKRGLEITGWTFSFEDININDEKQQAEILDRYVKSGVLTPNEARRELGLDPYEGGDVFYVPSTSTPVGAIDEKDRYIDESKEEEPEPEPQPSDNPEDAE